jgi:uncharacterized repeat protein (TIGR03803 family)
MQTRERLILFVTAFAAVFGLVTIGAPVFAAGTEQVLLSFGTGSGANPSDSLIFDPAGNLYGTTVNGGSCCGNVFQLTRGPGGQWTPKVLYNFCAVSGCPDGALPTAGLIFDAVGNLYGTTEAGGAYSYGTVFKLAPGAGGTWTETVLHSFNGTDGLYPEASVIFDPAGKLYGTTNEGGVYSGGTVFQLRPGGGGQWIENVLHSFNPAAEDGFYPYANLIFDAAGNLYGTTEEGGAYHAGTIVQLARGAHGTWTEKVLHSFNGADGYSLRGGLIFDAAGNLYGTAYSGGAYAFGTVFEFSPRAGGKWTEKILHSFSSADGQGPVGGLVVNAAGKLYGATAEGGDSRAGTVFQLTPGARGKWTESVLYSFNGADGYGPHAGLTFDTAGNLYGTTYQGGARDYGTVCLRSRPSGV